jgi:hypothetical protein
LWVANIVCAKVTIIAVHRHIDARPSLRVALPNHTCTRRTILGNALALSCFTVTEVYGAWVIIVTNLWHEIAVPSAEITKISCAQVIIVALFGFIDAVTRRTLVSSAGIFIVAIAVFLAFRDRDMHAPYQT